MPEQQPSRGKGRLRPRGLMKRGMLLSVGLFGSTGCLYNGREAADEAVKALAARPYDPLPPQLLNKTAASAGTDQTAAKTPGSPDKSKTSSLTAVPTDVQTSAYMESAQGANQAAPVSYQLHVPEAIPGSEVPTITLPADPAARADVLRKLYIPLPPLPAELQALPGPNGKPYTLADFQRLAAENSPTLRQAAFDVQAARGNLKQAETYQNPTVALQEQASNNNSTGGAFGFTFDQVISTGGKMRMQVATAQKQLDNSELALRRARSDLSTQVRTAYYALLVSKETMRVTRGLSVLTDEVYRVQLAFTEKAGQSAAYEPAALRAQAYTARLAHQQAIATYIYSWKQMTSAIGLRQLPLTEVAGRIDAAVPLYDYDKILGHVLRNHTDAQTAMNGIEVQKYNLKINQVQPYFPNLDFNVGMFKDRALLPYGTYATFGVSAPLPFWDQNRGNILSAEAALGKALEEPHRVEMALTASLATNFTNYKTNLDAVEYYRRYILPDQVRAYRGTLLRRQVDAGAQFGDLVAAQQALSTSVTTYLGLLGSLWSSVVSVADMIQTDDLFQTGGMLPLPELPDLDKLPPLPCCHPAAGTSAGCPSPGANPGGPIVIPPAAPSSTPLPQPTPLGAPQPQATQTPMPLPPQPQSSPAPIPTAPQPAPIPLTQPPRPLQLSVPVPTPSAVSATSFFKLTEEAFAALRHERVPDGVLLKLAVLKDRELPQLEFQSELSRWLNAAEASQYQFAILNCAFSRNQGEAAASTTMPISPLRQSGHQESAGPDCMPLAPAPTEPKTPAPGVVPSMLPDGM